MLELITLDDKGQVVINKMVVRTIHPFSKILKRNRRCDKDKSGAKKLVNLWEMLYIKCMGDALIDDGNIYAALGKRDRRRKITEDIGYPMGVPKDWLPDAEVKLGIKKYVEIQNKLVPSAAMLNSLEMAMLLTSKGVSSMNEGIQMMIDNVEDMKDKVEQGTDEEVIKQAIMKLSEISDALFDAMTKNAKIAKGIPDTLATIKILKSEVRIEQGKARKARGNKSIGLFEDP